MQPGVSRTFFVLIFVLNCLLWSHSRYASIPSRSPARSSLFSKRSLSSNGSSLSEGGNNTLLQEDQCHPISFPVTEQCTNVQDACPTPHTFLSIPYLQDYFCAEPAVRPAVFVGYLLWLLFLFSTLGISASDFFCPNLATLANLLGLDENVAGVTFLAFGNGSPDLFATFSAMRTNSGGLAIGELLGAASFVVSCVVGSMCIIKPFQVDRAPFLRDVGFFTVAVALLLVVLWDSKIESWEAISLVGLYLVYVTIVVMGSWWERRTERLRRKEELMRDEFREESGYLDEPYRDDPTQASSPASLLQVPSNRSRAISNPGPPRLGLQLPARPHTRDSSPHSFNSHTTHTTTPHLSHMPSFSLIGALEFSRVVSSLQEQAAGARLSLFESPVTPYAGGHYHTHSHHRYASQGSSRSRTPIGMDLERDPWDAALGVPLEPRSPQILVEDLEPPANGAVPVIAHTPASPLSTENESEVDHNLPPSRRPRFLRILRTTYHVLFPSLQDFRSKSLLGMIAAVFAAPALMALTLTLPVVVTDHHHSGSPLEKPENTSRLVDFEEEGVARALIAEEEVEEELHGLKFNRWLMAVQCALAPLFCVAILFDGNKHELWILLAAGVAGTATGLLVAIFGGRGEGSAGRLARCAMGFVVAVVWIMAIADEVVEVLQTFGLIFGLSDAIIGLTIFAMGNSLADLVANMSIAVFAPIMGFSACFGGPMLNILLGVGITGTYITRQTSEHYVLEFSDTLIITGTGLLVILVTTLIFVPWNNYFLPRSWGIALIIAYTCLMTANIIVEVKTNGGA